MQNLKNIYINFLNLFSPNQCLNCDKIMVNFDIKSTGILCHECIKKMQIITSPSCISCCEQMKMDMMHLEKCEDCIYNNWNFDQIIACVKYEKVALKVAINLKYNQSGGKFVANFLTAKGGKYIKKMDLITCIPLHWKRYIKRGFNQVDSICKELSELNDVKYIDDILIRKNNTKSQDNLSREQRIKNLQDAFVFNNQHSIRGKSVFLVDDVVTTSSTINEAAKILKKAGAKQVIVGCWAKRLYKDGENFDEEN